MVKVWVVVITAILVILATLFFIGSMANQAPVARLEGFGPEDAEGAEGKSREATKPSQTRTSKQKVLLQLLTNLS